MSQKNKPLVSIIMGSQSDYSTMRYAEEVLKKFRIRFETKIVSAHRTPEIMFEYAKNAMQKGLSSIIAGAGGAAGVVEDYRHQSQCAEHTYGAMPGENTVG